MAMINLYFNVPISKKAESRTRANDKLFHAHAAAMARNNHRLLIASLDEQSCHVDADHSRS